MFQGETLLLGQKLWVLCFDECFGFPIDSVKKMAMI
jgi:hypothetical protein